jgi:starch synthase
MNVLHVASELVPYSKTGGLADVASALPRALAGLARGSINGDRFAIVSPAYRVDPDQFGLARRLRRVGFQLGKYAVEVGVLEGRLPGGVGDVHVWLVEHPVFERPELYGEAGRDYPDNAFRFALLCRAALAISRAFGFPPDLIHAHDWQAAPALVYARRGEAPHARTVFTIHNLAFQGLFSAATVAEVDFGYEHFHPEGFEFWGQLSLLKAGLYSADRITTVSPQYAREIQTEEYGCGLDGYLRSRFDRFVGILNGADYDVWNPLRDSALAETYGPDRLDGKRACKADLQRALDLPVKPRVPILGAVSRLTDQKGFDLVIEVLAQLLEERDVQVAILGAGDPELEYGLQKLHKAHPRKLALATGYDEPLAHRIYAGSDLFLMPSRYEPCGLGQLYALRYGAVPIVRATGGLDDTVVDYDPRSQSGTGFKFDKASAASLDAAIKRALSVWTSEAGFASLVRRGMQQDFSWTASARAYRALYDSIRR